MSRSYIIVSAVHPIGYYKDLEDEDHVDIWEEIEPQLEELDRGYTKKYGERDPIVWEGVLETESYELPVYMNYHSNVDEEVIEIVIEKGLQDLSEAYLTDILDEINEELDRNFHLEVYHWYSGVDKPGGRGE